MPENYVGPPLPYLGGFAPGKLKMSDLNPPQAVPYLDFGAMQPPPWLDFSGWLEQFFPQPGAVLKPKRGQPVPSPGNPASEGGSQQSGLGAEIGRAVSDSLMGVIKFFMPSAAQKRDIAVYGLALIIFVVAIIAVLR